jgi:chromosome segregation ATPase
MTSDSTTEARWPLLEERTPFTQAARRPGRRKLPRSTWLLIGLSFLCGGLISAAGFSIGWRHQAQHDSVTQSALAAATARTHTLERRISALQASLDAARSATARAHAAAAAAAAAEQKLASAAGSVGDEATTTSGAASSISSGAGSLGAAATRIAGELKTLDTYLTTTPSGQLDPGYIASQAAFLEERLARLQGDAGKLGSSVSSLEAALRKLGRDAAALNPR